MKKRVMKVGANLDRDGLVIFFGPDMSAKSAVVTLKHLAKKIEREGFMIEEETDEYVVKSVSASL
jgi:hypothetical protein